MRRLVSISAAAILVVAALLAVTACQNPAATTSSTSSTGGSSAAQAQDLVNSAIALMKSGDYESALSDFSKAVLLDPTNGQAVIGYSALNIASVITDTTLVNTMQNNVGLTNYPSTMAAVLDPTTWAQTETVNGTPTSMPMMAVSGQQDYDGDGVVDFGDWGESLAAYVATHNTGFDFIPTTLNTALGTRVDTAIAAIKQSVTDSMSFTITWDMLYTTQPSSSQWPYDSGGNPMPIVIGKAELLSMASFLEALRADLHLAMVYSLSLPSLADYWNDFGPNSTGTTNPTTKPFSTFLQLNSDAATQLAAAKTNLTASLADRITAANDFISDRAGFSLSSDPSTTIFTGSGYSSFIQGVKIVKDAAEQAQSSIATNTPAIFPITVSSTFNPDTDWPTSVVAGSSIGFNYGVALSSPLALISTSGLFQLASSGDPQFYSLDPSTGAFSAISASTTINGGSTNFSVGTDQNLAFLKVTDATFGGILSLASIPTDNQSSLSGYNLEQLAYNDANSSGFWDSGESISSAVASRTGNGIVDLSTLQAYASGSRDLTNYFLQNPTGTTSPQLIYNWSSYTSDESGLESAVAGLSLYSYAGPAIDAAGTVVLDNTSSPEALYISVPDFYAWLSFAANNNVAATSPQGTTVYGQGSIYWYLMGHTAQH